MEPKVAKEIVQAQWRFCISIQIPLILYAWVSTLQMSCFLSLISSTYSFQIILASEYTQGYTVDRAPLYEKSAHCRDLYLTARNIHNK